MMRFLLPPALAVALLTGCLAGSVRAEQNQFGVEIGTPQTEMFKRVEAYVNAYANRIGIGDPFWQYCHTKLNWSHAHEPTDGLIPFGTNYNNIRSESEMDRVINAREAYQKSYLVLCLADAKRTLEQAEHK